MHSNLASTEFKDHRAADAYRIVGQRKPLVFENVPLVGCPYCGERYLMAETSHKLERIRLPRRHFAKAGLVVAAEFAA